jgi:hypothetical protein
MDNLLSFLMKSTISSGILLAYYCFVLRNRRFHQFNRFYLLSTILISLTVPLLSFRRLIPEQSANLPVNAFFFAVSSFGERTGIIVQSWGWIVDFTWATSGIFLLTVLLFKIEWIYKMKKAHANIKMNGFNLIETELEEAPFAFLDNLFWKKSISRYSETGERIFQHELVHVYEMHTYDKLFSQLVLCFFWMNPFYWIIQKELFMVHEFIADQKSMRQGDARSFARVLLSSRNAGAYLNPANYFFQSPIKRRLMMITTSSPARYTYMGRVMAAPLIALVIAICSCTFVQAQQDKGTKTAGTVERSRIPLTKEQSRGLAKICNGSKQKIRLYVLYSLNGSLVSPTQIKKLDQARVRDMKLLNSEQAMRKYGTTTRDGVVEFITE